MVVVHVEGFEVL